MASTASYSFLNIDTLKPQTFTSKCTANVFPPLYKVSNESQRIQLCYKLFIHNNNVKFCKLNMKIQKVE